MARVIAIRGISLVAMHCATKVDRSLMKWTKGRLRLSFIIPVLLLQCRGARTNVTREIPLLYVPCDNTPLLVGSNGGGLRDPSWCYNLRAHPRITCLVEGKERQFRAEELFGERRERAWNEALSIYPGYALYARRVTRLIPIFQLFPV